MTNEQDIKPPLPVRLLKDGSVVLVTKEMQEESSRKLYASIDALSKTALAVKNERDELAKRIAELEAADHVSGFVMRIGVLEARIAELEAGLRKVLPFLLDHTADATRRLLAKATS